MDLHKKSSITADNIIRSTSEFTYQRYYYKEKHNPINSMEQ